MKRKRRSATHTTRKGRNEMKKYDVWLIVCLYLVGIVYFSEFLLPLRAIDHWYYKVLNPVFFILASAVPVYFLVKIIFLVKKAWIYFLVSVAPMLIFAVILLWMIAGLTIGGVANA